MEMFYLSCAAKLLIEKSNECHSQTPQPTPDAKRKQKRTNVKRAACKINIQMHKEHKALASSSELITMLKETKEARGQTARQDSTLSARNYKPQSHTE